MIPVATWWERSTRFVMLVALPNGHKADLVADALAAKISTLPAALTRTLTWDQDHEMASHIQFTEALAARLQREHQRSAPSVPAPQIERLPGTWYIIWTSPRSRRMSTHQAPSSNLVYRRDTAAEPSVHRWRPQPGA
jgi:hypothetical protein